jgi:hypothetical protein
MLRQDNVTDLTAFVPDTGRETALLLQVADALWESGYPFSLQLVTPTPTFLPGMTALSKWSCWYVPALKERDCGRLTDIHFLDEPMRYLTAGRGAPQIKTTHLAILTYRGSGREDSADPPRLQHLSWGRNIWEVAAQSGFIIDGPLPALRSLKQRAAPFLLIPDTPVSRAAQPKGWGRMWVPFHGTHLQIWACTLRLREASRDLEITIGHSTILNAPTTLLAQYSGRSAMVAAMSACDHIVILDSKSAMIDTSLGTDAWVRLLTDMVDQEDRIHSLRWRRDEQGGTFWARPARLGEPGIALLRLTSPRTISLPLGSSYMSASRRAVTLISLRRRGGYWRS